MKKVISIILALVFVFALTACGGNNTPSNPPASNPSSNPPAASPENNPPPANPSNNQPAENPPPGGADNPPAAPGNDKPWNPDNINSHKFILAHGMAPENVVSKCYHAFCEYVADLSEGKIIIEEKIGGTLVNDLQTFDALRDGTVDFIHSMGSYISSTITDISPLTLDGYYGGDDWLDFAFSTKDLVESIYADYGIKFLGGLYQGTAVFASSKVQVKQPGDVKGLAWRASGDWAIKTVEAWGGAATNIGLPNLADAFQKGTVEGATTGWTIVGGWGIYEVAKYLTTSEICEGFAALLMNGDTWKSLNADEQALIAYAGDMFVRNNYELTQVECQNYFDRISAEGGNEIYTLTPAENKPFIDIVYSLYDDMAKSLGPKGLQLIDTLKQFNGAN